MEWNRRDFMVGPMVIAGTASVLGRTDSLLTKLLGDSGPLIQRTLGKTGLTMPVVSMGVMNADIPGILRRSYELGIRHFDTAAGYQGGRNEEMVGSVIKELGVRQEVIIATKQHMRNRPPNIAEAKRQFIDGVEASLRRLQMDHVEILYYHAVDSVEDARANGPLEALQTLKKQGKTRFIGLSTHKTSEILPEAMRQNIFDVFLVTLN
jgi:aryl-alcohol dehydrogenase-like predicted oxidoreductase